MCEINKLTCIQLNLEKSISTIIGHLTRFSNFESVSKLSSIIEQERQSEKSNLRVSVKEIICNIKSKSDFLKQTDSMDKVDLTHLKNDMISIQDSIQILISNSKMKLRSLQIDYIDVNQDVEYYNEKLFEWSQPTNLNNINFKLDYKPPNTKLKCVEMREFIDFLRRSGGHENGWDKSDHQLFLKYRNKYKDINVITKKLHELLPDKKIDEIKQHEEWYKEYLILKSNKKDAIKRWQKSKNKDKPYSITVPDEYQQTSSKIVNCHENLREKLTKWKLEKEMHLQININAEQEIQHRKKEQEKLRKKKNCETKQIIEEWKKTKLSLEEEESSRRKIQEQYERKRRAAEANKLIKQFQTQDDFYILKMKQHKRTLQNSILLRSKSSQLAARDPERLFKPTQQWINRVHDENIYPIEAVIPLKKLPKLGIPEWRRKIE